MEFMEQKLEKRLGATITSSEVDDLRKQVREGLEVMGDAKSRIDQLEGEISTLKGLVGGAIGVGVLGIGTFGALQYGELFTKYGELVQRYMEAMIK